MEEIGFSLEAPPNYQSSGAFQFGIALESLENEERQMIEIVNRIEIFDLNGNRRLSYLTARYVFEILDFSRHIHKDKKGVCMLPTDLQLGLNTIAISTSRGLLFAALKGTVLHKAVLPVMDVTTFEKNELADS